MPRSIQSDLDSIRYEQSKLTEVIARVDLTSPISALQEELPKEISKAALGYFPISEPLPAVKKEVAMSLQETSTREQRFTQWNFHGRNREKLFCIEPQAFYVRYAIYESYETLRSEFLAVGRAIFDSFDQAQPSRLGLRYINQIEPSGRGPLAWNEYVNGELLGLLSYKMEGAQPIRIWNNVELAFDEFNLRFQFGVHNPDLPARIKRGEFILDYDAYFKGLIDPDEISDQLDKYHDTIQTMFERSITDDLREVMNAASS